MDLKTIEEALNAVAQAELAANRSGSQSSQPATQAAAQSAPQPPEPRTFWTSCKNCGFFYEHFRFYLNWSLLCANCNQPFQAVETPEPEASLDFTEAKASGRFPWGPLDRNAASPIGVNSDLPKDEGATGLKRKRTKRVSLKKILKKILKKVLRERGEIYIANKLELLNQQ